jgi:RNA polymerase sigma-70 factor (ECF subfamily)
MIELRMNTSEAELLAGLYNRLGRRLYAYALSLTGDAARSEDAVHDAFVRLLQYAPGRGIKSLEGLLFTTTRNLILDERRRLAIRRDAPLPLTQVSGEPDEAASRALGRLPEEQREAVVLKIFADLTFAEIGEVMGTTLDTAAGRYRLGIEKLAQLLPRNE